MHNKTSQTVFVLPHKTLQFGTKNHSPIKCLKTTVQEVLLFLNHSCEATAIQNMTNINRHMIQNTLLKKTFDKLAA